MALTLNSSPNHAFEIMADFGVTQSLISKAKSYGIEATRNENGSILIKHKGTTYASVPVKSATLSLMKQGTLGPASKNAFKGQFDNALEKAIAAAEAGGALSKIKPAFESLSKKVEDAPKQEPTEPKPVTQVMPTQSVLTAKPTGYLPKVALKDATACYQQVEGTSASADYRVFAMFNGLNLAVKVDGTDFAIRAEGTLLSAYATRLNSFGIPLKGGYASGHFKASSTELIVKSLGAVASLMGFQTLIGVADMASLIKDMQ